MTHHRDAAREVAPALHAHASGAGGETPASAAASRDTEASSSAANMRRTLGHRGAQAVALGLVAGHAGGPTSDAKRSRGDSVRPPSSERASAKPSLAKGAQA